MILICTTVNNLSVLHLLPSRADSITQVIFVLDDTCVNKKYHLKCHNYGPISYHVSVTSLRLPLRGAGGHPKMPHNIWESILQTLSPSMLNKMKERRGTITHHYHANLIIKMFSEAHRMPSKGVEWTESLSQRDEIAELGHERMRHFKVRQVE